MKSIITKIFVAVFFLALFSFGIPLPTHADDICTMPNVNAAMKASAGCSGFKTGTIDSTIKNIINAIMVVIASICVIIIIIGGFQYMTSTGDPGKVKKAKDTIIYAIIGLIIVIFAAVIVNIVIANINK